MDFPERWRDTDADKWFVEAIRVASALQLAVVIPRNLTQFPSSQEVVKGTIDVWWVVHDGGMLILLAFLLQADKVWRGCRLRVFTVSRVCVSSVMNTTEDPRSTTIRCSSSATLPSLCWVCE
jgi:potassium/chloride transporter 4/5/6